MIETRLHLDRAERTITAERLQDCEPILDHNAQLRSMPQTSDMMRHVASIPAVILEKWLMEEWQRGNVTLKLFGPEMDALVERKLRDPDWKWLRVDR